MERILTRIAVFGLALATLHCTNQGTAGHSTVDIPASLHAGKVHLTRFEGEQARTAFLPVADEFRKSQVEEACPAVYGLVLADFQIALARLNPVLETFIREAKIVPPAPTEPGADGWTEWSAYLEEAAEYAGAVTLAGCSFDIGVDPDEAQERLSYAIFAVGNTVPAVEVRFRARFDGAEARVMAAVAEAALGAGDMLFAHDLSFAVSAGKLALQLGTNEACIRKNWLRCMQTPDPGHAPVNLLDWAFVFADNPRFLSAAPDWAGHFPDVPRRFATAFAMLRTVFPALHARTSTMSSDDREARRAEEFALRYIDVDGDERFGQIDILGVNVDSVVLDCATLQSLGAAPWPLDECIRRFSDYTALINAAVLPIARSAASPDAAIVAELESLFDAVHANFQGVSDPGYVYEPIAFTALNRLMTEFVPLFDTPAPAFLAFDVAAFFRDGKPVRSFVPAWTAAGPTGARFLLDSDDYAYASPPPTAVTLPQTYFDEAYGGMAWSLMHGDLASSYAATTVTERNLFACPGERCTPADCLNAANLYTEVSAELFGLGAGTTQIAVPVMNAWFPDPALHGLVRIDDSAWTPGYGPGNGAATWGSLTCADAAGFAPATNATLHKSGWLSVDFVLDHFAFLPLVLEALPR